MFLVYAFPARLGPGEDFVKAGGKEGSFFQ
jgi:hypothetical protein